MVLSDNEQLNQNGVTIVAEAYHDSMICRYCGKEYSSRGKDDPGYCKECGLKFLSGPLDGKKVGEIRDNYRSKTEAD